MYTRAVTQKYLQNGVDGTNVNICGKRNQQKNKAEVDAGQWDSN